jgi:UPF0755 protein
MRTRRLKLLAVVGVLIGLAVGGLLWVRKALTPMPDGPAIFIRFWRPLHMGDALTRLQQNGVVRDHLAMHLYALIRKAPGWVASGTYLVKPGQSPSTVLRDLDQPVRQLVRMPETNWARRDARLLARYQVVTADAYLASVQAPARFKTMVDFPLPSDTLEGYLYPDTYDFPPLLGADSVIERRLKAFQTKVWEKIGKPANLDRILKVASLVELEAGTDEDRSLIAGVIQNRIAKGMPLQIDASIIYSLGKWRRLYYKDYAQIKSPYNLYLHKGLPPTPICSPSLKSIQAALKPAKNSYLYYVALPGGKSLFASTYKEHEGNVEIRRAVVKLLDLFS